MGALNTNIRYPDTRPKTVPNPNSNPTINSNPVANTISHCITQKLAKQANITAFQFVKTIMHMHVCQFRLSLVNTAP